MSSKVPQPCHDGDSQVNQTKGLQKMNSNKKNHTDKSIQA